MPTPRGLSAPARARALVVAGAGSDEAFIARAFPAIRGIADEVVPIGTHGGSLDAVTTTLGAQVRKARTEGLRVIVAGVSFGAHAAAAYAAASSNDQMPDGLACIMPAWSGPPGLVAASTAATAQQVHDLGIDSILADLRDRYADDWVVEELMVAWPQRSPLDLAAELRAVASSHAPTPAELAGIDIPVAVLGLRDDPMHPVEIAQEWAEAISRAALVTFARQEPAQDRAVLGRTAFALLASAFR